MDDARRPRLVWSGFAFVALYLIGLTLTTYDATGVDEPLSALPSFYADSGSRLAVLVGGLVLAAARRVSSRSSWRRPPILRVRGASRRRSPVLRQRSSPPGSG